MGTLLSISKAGALHGLHASEWALFICGAILVVGLLAEGEIVGEYRKPWASRLAAKGALLVIIGVAGELFADGGVFFFSEKLQEIADQELAAVTHETGLANERAAKNERAAEQLRKDAEQLRKEGEQLRKDSESERLARVKIEEAVAWRRLTKGQKRDIGDTLKTFAGIEASPSYNVGDTEGQNFVLEIDEALIAGHWNVSTPSSNLAGMAGGATTIETGVTVVGADDKFSLEAAIALATQLSSRGFDAIPRRGPAWEKPTVWVNVNPRPEGAQGEAKLRKQNKHSKAKTK